LPREEINNECQGTVKYFETLFSTLSGRVLVCGALGYSLFLGFTVSIYLFIYCFMPLMSFQNIGALPIMFNKQWHRGISYYETDPNLREKMRKFL